MSDYKERIYKLEGTERFRMREQSDFIHEPEMKWRGR